MAGHGLQFFKVNKTVTHVCVARPHYLDLQESPVSEGLQRIVEYVRTHEGCSRKDLVEALAPTPPPAEGAPQKNENVSSPAAAPEDIAASPSPANAQPGDPAPATPSTESASTKVEVKPTSEQTAVVGDLHWLIHQGHVIEFANGRLESAKKPKPRPEPKPKRAPTGASPVARPAEGSPESEPKAVTVEGPAVASTEESRVMPVEEATAAPTEPASKTEEPGSADPGTEASPRRVEPAPEAVSPESQEAASQETEPKTEPDPRPDAPTAGAA